MDAQFTDRIAKQRKVDRRRKLTDAQKAMIRLRRGERVEDLGREYGVYSATISKIQIGRKDQ